MSTDRVKLSELRLSGFKSIGSEVQIQFGDITILLGANGSGKSNLISFFKMINFMSTKGFQLFIARQGGSDSFLHYGARNTEKIEFSLTLEQSIEDKLRLSSYSSKLVHGAPDRLFLAMEKVSFHEDGKEKPLEFYIEAGSKESGLPDDERSTSKFIFHIISRIKTYHFHDTSDTAKIKLNNYIGECQYLRSDAGNLAAFLRAMRLSPELSKYYDRIIRHIQKVMPQFGDFALETTPENERYVLLNWYDTSHDHLFGPHQISDGSLRFMALATLLLQPPQMMPNVIVLDEPELGLHPSAISELAGMIRTASAHCQVVVATQSTRLVDKFQLSHLVIVERDRTNRYTLLKRLDEEKMADWLSRYSLSELWEKNVLGGKP